MPYAVTDIQPTPNPNALKFILDRRISDQTISFFTAGSGNDHPIASKLFAVPGVSSLLLLGDFVTVNKRPEVPWKGITSRVKDILKNSD